MSQTVGGTIWVCTDCMFLHANGDMPIDPRPGEPVPWALWTGPETVTMGVSREEHDEGCDPNEECACEYQSFTWASCDGCGSDLGGSRYGFTYWVDSVDGKTVGTRFSRQGIDYEVISVDTATNTYRTKSANGEEKWF